MQGFLINTISILFLYQTLCIFTYQLIDTISIFTMIYTCSNWNEMLFQLDFQQINVKCWKPSWIAFTDRNIYPICRFFLVYTPPLLKKKHWFSVETTVFQAIFAAENAYIRRFADFTFAYVNTFQQFQPSDCWNLKG